MRAGAGSGIALLVLAGCVTSTPPVRCPADPDHGITVLSRGWHTEIGVPAGLLSGGAAQFRQVFPGARTIMFGFGKRTFMTAPPDTPAEYLLGPFPGPAVIEVIGLSGLPAGSYGSQDMVRMPLSTPEAAALSAFLWASIRKDRTGAPRLIGQGRFPGSVFYAAGTGYSIVHTCNTWVAEALQAAGLPVSPDLLVFSGQTMAAAAQAMGTRCRPAP